MMGRRDARLPQQGDADQEDGEDAFHPGIYESSRVHSRHFVITAGS